MTECLSHVVRVLREGKEAGVFAIDDPDQVAKTMYALGLGGLQLERLGVVVRETAPGVPVVEAVPAGTVGAQLVEATVALAHVTDLAEDVAFTQASVAFHSALTGSSGNGVLDLLAEQRTTLEIATALEISTVTVRRHVSGLLAKLGVDDREAAVEAARAHTR